MQETDSTPKYLLVIVWLGIVSNITIFLYLANQSSWNIGFTEVFLGVIFSNLPMWNLYIWHKNKLSSKVDLFLKGFSYVTPFLVLVMGLASYILAIYQGIANLWMFLWVAIGQGSIMWLLLAIIMCYIPFTKPSK